MFFVQYLSCDIFYKAPPTLAQHIIANNSRFSFVISLAINNTQSIKDPWVNLLRYSQNNECFQIGRTNLQNSRKQRHAVAALYLHKGQVPLIEACFTKRFNTVEIKFLEALHKKTFTLGGMHNFHNNFHHPCSECEDWNWGGSKPFDSKQYPALTE